MPKYYIVAEDPDYLGSDHCLTFEGIVDSDTPEAALEKFFSEDEGTRPYNGTHVQIFVLLKDLNVVRNSTIRYEPVEDPHV